MAKTNAAKRRDAAEQVCWTLMLMMSIGMLELPDASRVMLGNVMEVWSDLAVRTGELKA
jgi:hypothetical protein